VSSHHESVKKTLWVALLLSLVCSILVAGSAVLLKSRQEVNKQQDRQKNILLAAGLYNPQQSIAEQFQQVETKVVNLATGQYVSIAKPETFDELAAAKDPKQSIGLTNEQDIARIKRRANYAPVYLIKKDNRIETIILPVYGYGLWSIMYGYLALKGDGNTVTGITFYQQGETAGLGAEITNPKWQALWPGKEVYNAQHQPVIDLVKGNVTAATPSAEHKVDAISGATLTSNGVTNLLHFWLGQLGFGPYLANLTSGKLSS
jgi:Na+-transporting NADH:ubiquinone oxidoreductase subunit C